MVLFDEQNNDIHRVHEKILKKIEEYNELMNSAIEGPNCIDPLICKSDCCHIKIDIPKFLAQYYINQNLAIEENFTRGDVFSFKIAVDPKTSKCSFYDKSINGCSLHQSKMKPPQCWIYPTGFSNDPSDDKKFAENGTIRCKKIEGWKILDEEKTFMAQKILLDYIKVCEDEFKIENSKENIRIRLKEMENALMKIPPSKIAGIKDGWSSFSYLSSEGISLKIKKICDNIGTNSSICNYNYLECPKICQEVVFKIISNLLSQVMNFIGKNGANEDYSFQDLWVLEGKKKSNEKF